VIADVSRQELILAKVVGSYHSTDRGLYL